jgi:hypothetical protein
MRGAVLPHNVGIHGVTLNYEQGQLYFSFTFQCNLLSSLSGWRIDVSFDTLLTRLIGLHRAMNLTTSKRLFTAVVVINTVILSHECAQTSC